MLHISTTYSGESFNKLYIYAYKYSFISNVKLTSAFLHDREMVAAGNIYLSISAFTPNAGRTSNEGGT